ncbi:MAG: hypothetical protein Q9M40_07005 [Sulfurimonas sp.]|nr:hypothetical protein [Sulfurimonas sp.]
MQRIDIFTDNEFQSLELKEKRSIAKNYFDKEMADDDFHKLDTKTKQGIQDNFVDAQLDFDVSDTLDKVHNWREPRHEPVEAQAIADKKEAVKQTLQEPVVPTIEKVDTSLLPEPIENPFNKLPQTQEEAIAQANTFKESQDDTQELDKLKSEDLPLQDATLDIAFAGAGAIRAGQGVIANAFAKTAPQTIAAQKMIYGGQAFAKGDIVGQFAATAAMGVADEFISDEFQEQNPLTAGLIQLSVGVLAGGYAGYKAEKQVMQKWLNLAEDVKSGKVTAQNAEEILAKDESLFKM